MNEIEAVEATRREFEAVMRLPGFASIEQVAADLGALTDPTATRPVLATTPVDHASGGSHDLPSRTRAC